MMLDFYSFIKENFDSPAAIQFKMANGKIMFYEKTSSFSLSSFAKSFLKTDVASLMGTKNTNFRSVIVYNEKQFHCFVWDSTLLHQNVMKYLDANKGKYPELRYLKLYNEASMFMPNEKIPDTWLFSFIIWQGHIESNIFSINIIELDKQKDLKSLFKLSDSQFNSLIQKNKLDL